MKVNLIGVSFKNTGTGIERYEYELSQRLKNVVDLKLRSPLISHPVARIIYQLVLPLNTPEEGIVHAMCPTYGLNLSKNKFGIVTFHDLNVATYADEQSFFVGEYNKFTQKRAAKVKTIISNSQQTKNELIKEYGVKPENVHVVNLGVDEKFKPLNLFRNAVGHFGGLTPRKNPLGAINVFKKIEHKIPDYKLVLHSNGKLYDECVNMVKKYDVNAALAGFVPEEKLIESYNSCKAVLYTSMYEGFGLPILEAEACGTPVLTLKEAKISDEVKEGTIICDNEDEMSERLLELVNDTKEWKRASQKAIAHAAKFSWDKMAKETLLIYKTIYEC